MTDTPGNSDHTSIKERITPRFNLADALREQLALEGLNEFNLPVKPLLHFEGCVKSDEQCGILFSFEDYLNLIDTTGRCIRDDKRGSIPRHLAPILVRLEIDSNTWLINATQFESIYQKRFSKRFRSSRNVA